MLSVLITWARLVGLNSPDRVFIVTSFKFSFAFTDVKRTLHSLQESSGLYHIFDYDFEPFFLYHI